MSKSQYYESMFWKLLEKEKLADLSQFHKPRYFDEVPLYSRYSDISFLGNEGNDKANAFLLRFSLKFLKALISYEEHAIPFFAAITVWSYGQSETLVPNLFVRSGPILKLKDKLALDAPTTLFGKKAKQLVSKLHLPERFEVLEDTLTTPELSRVFIGPSRPPYLCFVSPSKFRRSATRV